MPVAQVGDDRTIGAWYLGIPPITRALLTTYLITGLGFMIGVVPLKYMYLDWGLVSPLRLLRSRQSPELWRLVTNFTFIGKPSFGYLIQLVWLVTYGGAVEASDFRHNIADGIWMLMVGMGSTLALDVVPLFRTAFHDPSLVLMLLYLWSKRNPTAPVSIFGLIRLQGAHLPFAMMGISLITGGNWISDLVGILAGHVYYFLKDVYPRTGGRDVLKTPVWLMRLVHRWGLGRVPVQDVQPTHPSDRHFRAFHGRGRRLAD